MWGTRREHVRGDTKNSCRYRERLSAIRNNLSGRHLCTSHVVTGVVSTERSHGGEDGVDEEDDPAERY